MITGGAFNRHFGHPSSTGDYHIVEARRDADAHFTPASDIYRPLHRYSTPCFHLRRSAPGPTTVLTSDPGTSLTLCGLRRVIESDINNEQSTRHHRSLIIRTNTTVSVSRGRRLNDLCRPDSSASDADPPASNDLPL